MANEHPSKLQLLETKDGSYTLYRPDLDEHYHSIHGARTESQHVFIQHGLEFLVTNLEREKDLSILEVGFGTGYNALLSLLFLENNPKPKNTNYTALELFPVAEELWRELMLRDEFLKKHQNIFSKMHSCTWNTRAEINPGFFLQKLNCDALHWKSLQKFDLIYFDAFGFRAQEEMWNLNFFRQLRSMAKPGGIWVTYAAKGIVRRQMQEAGWQVERLPGPPGKREMLRAINPMEI